MNEHRILTTFRALDGPDEIEDQWLNARNMVMNISNLESPEQIDKDSIQEKFNKISWKLTCWAVCKLPQTIVSHAHRGKHDEIQLGLVSIYVSIGNQGMF